MLMRKEKRPGIGKSPGREAGSIPGSSTDPETSARGSSQSGDIRSGPVKRLAASVGQGGVALAQVHRHPSVPASRGRFALRFHYRRLPRRGVRDEMRSNLDAVVLIRDRRFHVCHSPITKQSDPRVVSGAAGNRTRFGCRFLSRTGTELRNDIALTVQLRSLRGASSNGFPPDWPPCASSRASRAWSSSRWPRAVCDTKDLPSYNAYNAGPSKGDPQ
jgi:hypothetical protein